MSISRPPYPPRPRPDMAIAASKFPSPPFMPPHPRSPTLPSSPLNPHSFTKVTKHDFDGRIINFHEFPKYPRTLPRRSQTRCMREGWEEEKKGGRTRARATTRRWRGRGALPRVSLTLAAAYAACLADATTFGHVRDASRSILNQFLFPAPKSSYTWASFRGKIICVVGREANFVPCMLIPGESTKSTAEKKQHASCLAIYCHANGEDIGILHEAGKWISDHLGVHVMIPEYPGYGMAPGRAGQPNELSVNRNIRAAYEFAVHALQWDPSHILFVGRSIGTGPAVRLAAEVRCGGLILISPYTSVRDMVNNSRRRRRRRKEWRRWQWRA
eukprot:153835-Hanusia_phi.AAC.3